MFGDLFQSPPQLSSKELYQYFARQYGGYYFFHAPAIKALNPVVIDLSTVYKNQTDVFRAVQSAIRKGSRNERLLDVLNQRVDTKPTRATMALTSSYAVAEQINQYQLGQLSGKARQYHATTISKLKNAEYPTDQTIKLKKGAQVVMLKDNPNGDWVKGAVGTVKTLNKNSVRVTINGVGYTIHPESWSTVKHYYDHDLEKIAKEISFSFMQLPLRLGWASAIAQTKGHIYQSVILDLRDGQFLPGQAYLAINRCQTLEHLHLTADVQPEDISVDPQVVQYMQTAITVRKQTA